MINDDCIIALATASGSGAIAIIRISGEEAITICDSHFKSVSHKKLASQKTHTIHLGHIIKNEKALDEVLVSVFKNPKWTNNDCGLCAYTRCSSQCN